MSKRHQQRGKEGAVGTPAEGVWVACVSDVPHTPEFRGSKSTKDYTSMQARTGRGVELGSGSGCSSRDMLEQRGGVRGGLHLACGIQGRYGCESGKG